MAVTTTLTNLPTPPQSTDPANFSTRADAFVTALDNFQVEMNDVIGEVNSTETNMTALESSATLASNSAVASANFKGVWNSVTAYTVPSSVELSGRLYLSLQASTNKNPSTEPTYWMDIGFASQIHAATSKTTPVDADELALVDSEASFGLKKLSLANLWNYIKAKADLLYAPIGYGNSLLTEYVVTGSAVTSINFSGLDINTHKSYRIEVELLNATASSATISCFVNNDTSGGNYYTQELQASGATIAGSRINAAYVCSLDASGFVSATQFVSRTNGYAGIKSFASRLSGASLNRDDYYMVKSATVTNITQLTFVSSVASSIGVGSKIRIYRGDI